MHVVEKKINGHEYYYWVEKGRRGKRVITTRTIYIGNWAKLTALLQDTATAALPSSYTSKEVGASLAFTQVAQELGIEELIDKACPVRAGASPVGRQLLLIALHRILAPRGENGLNNIREFYNGCALEELLPLSEANLDDRRLGETLTRLSAKQVDAIESAVVKRVIEHEKVGVDALAFDCTNFDSYAAATTRSRLLKRGHGKSGRSLRVLGMGLLVTEDGGIPLLTLSYPGNENDVTAFRRFLGALERRKASLALPLEATIAADGGNISKEILRQLEQQAQHTRHYVMRLPQRHASALSRVATNDLPILEGLLGKVRAQKYDCSVYEVNRCVVDTYSPRMHRRQLPGLLRDRKKARGDLLHLQKQLDLQRQGLRKVKPITLAALRRRAKKALAREHMEDLFTVQTHPGDLAPALSFQENDAAWKHLETHVLGRTLLVTSRKDWSAERIVRASRKQSYNERFFREIKDPTGASMLPLRHRRDPALRAAALVVVLGLMLAKILLRRLQKAGVKVRSVAMMLRHLRRIHRGRMRLTQSAPPALRTLAATTWIPAERTQRQDEILAALNLAPCRELGTTPFSSQSRSSRAEVKKTAR